MKLRPQKLLQQANKRTNAQTLNKQTTRTSNNLDFALCNLFSGSIVRLPSEVQNFERGAKPKPNQCNRA